jgi:exopolysaccharide biosynthesis protein
MITVDGRFSGKAEGMSAKELALFIQKHFNPRWAINMDGGGSTTMYIKGADTPCGVDGVVNHPCNSGSTWTKANLRNLNTFFLIKYNE